MRVDLLLRNARIAGAAGPIDIAVVDGRIAALAPDLVCEAVESEDLGGCFAFPGFVETHIHLDKAGILGRCRLCEGTLAEAVAETARAKAGFTEDDVHARASRVVAAAILHGTTRMRTFVEVDPRVGLRSLAAIRRVRDDFAGAIDLEICAFAQEGLTQEPETERLLDAALAAGADLIGGCPYTDPDPDGHIIRIFALARRHGVDVDFHLDFDLDPSWSHLPQVIAETERNGWGGRVTVGHVTKLAMAAQDEVEATARRLAEAGVALTVLPATDLFLTGRDLDRARPRGVAPAHLLAAAGVVTSIATNNVSNPFTPYGDASLLRMANLYANVAQLASDDDLAGVFDMVGASAAKLVRQDWGLRVGGPADVVVLDAPDAVTALREIAPTVAGWKRGRKSFERPRARLLPGAGDRR
ncbi:amidohydrolase [Siculibacillus lacustris]|uniref:Amidohydrolase n=1 Tax=Siculibacillus lacustris TaxID=1549641 RepID=A0A4Q9W083_9HYPH|nr:amidohydrolase family protein [Siculibacillus lacustris]TBW41393.1 amidohydrolase [Siculibacillus lacustris]